MDLVARLWLGRILSGWEVARGRFELPSAGDSCLESRDPEPTRGLSVESGPKRPLAMLDHYTTGLRTERGAVEVHKAFRSRKPEVTYMFVETLK